MRVNVLCARSCINVSQWYRNKIYPHVFTLDLAFVGCGLSWKFLSTKESKEYTKYFHSLLNFRSCGTLFSSFCPLCIILLHTTQQHCGTELFRLLIPCVMSAWWPASTPCWRSLLTGRMWKLDDVLLLTT